MQTQSSESNQLIVWGAGGHAKVVYDAIPADTWKLQCFVVNVPTTVSTLLSQKVCQVESPPDWIKSHSAKAFVAIGDNSVRRSCTKGLHRHHLEIIYLVSPSASVSTKATVSAGVFVGPNAVVNSGSRLSTGCIVNSAAVVEHDCEVGEFAHIGPGTVLAGNVRVGPGTLVGLGSRVLPGVTIGKDVIIGAGSVVTKDVSDGTVVSGIPAKLHPPHLPLSSPHHD